MNSNSAPSRQSTSQISSTNGVWAKTVGLRPPGTVSQWRMRFNAPHYLPIWANTLFCFGVFFFYAAAFSLLLVGTLVLRKLVPSRISFARYPDAAWPAAIVCYGGSLVCLLCWIWLEQMWKKFCHNYANEEKDINQKRIDEEEYILWMQRRSVGSSRIVNALVTVFFGMSLFTLDKTTPLKIYRSVGILFCVFPLIQSIFWKHAYAKWSAYWWMFFLALGAVLMELYAYEVNGGIISSSSRGGRIGGVAVNNMIYIWAALCYRSPEGYRWQWMLAVMFVSRFLAPNATFGWALSRMISHLLVFFCSMMVAYNREYLSRHNFYHTVNLRQKGIVFFPLEKHNIGGLPRIAEGEGSEEYDLGEVRDLGEEDEEAQEQKEEKESVEEEEKVEEQKKVEENQRIPFGFTESQEQQSFTAKVEQWKRESVTVESVQGSAVRSATIPSVSFHGVYSTDAEMDRLVEYLSVDILSIWDTTRARGGLRRRQKFTKVFRDPSVEKAFVEWHAKRTWYRVRVSVFLFVLGDALFGLYDWIVVKPMLESFQFQELIFHRYVVLIPLTFVLAYGVYCANPHQQDAFVSWMMIVNGAVLVFILARTYPWVTNVELWQGLSGMLSMSLVRLQIHASTTFRVKLVPATLISFLIAILHLVGHQASINRSYGPVGSFPASFAVTIVLGWGVASMEEGRYRDQFVLRQIRRFHEEKDGHE